jgi:hypothetical protein
MVRWLGISSIVLGVISIMLGAYVEFGRSQAGVSGFVPIALGLGSLVIGLIVIRQFKNMIF